MFSAQDEAAPGRTRTRITMEVFLYRRTLREDCEEVTGMPRLPLPETFPRTETRQTHCFCVKGAQKCAPTPPGQDYPFSFKLRRDEQEPYGPYPSYGCTTAPVDAARCHTAVTKPCLQRLTEPIQPRTVTQHGLLSPSSGIWRPVNTGIWSLIVKRGFLTWTWSVSSLRALGSWKQMQQVNWTCTGPVIILSVHVSGTT